MNHQSPRSQVGRAGVRATRAKTCAHHVWPCMASAVVLYRLCEGHGGGHPQKSEGDFVRHLTDPSVLLLSLHAHVVHPSHLLASTTFFLLLDSVMPGHFCSTGRDPPLLLSCKPVPKAFERLCTFTLLCFRRAVHLPQGQCTTSAAAVAFGC
jgi:hypothetical protein